MKVTDVYDGKVQVGCNLFHNLQAWQPRERGQQLDRCINLLPCVWFTVTEPCENQGCKFIGWRHWPSQFREISCSRREKSVVEFYMVALTQSLHLHFLYFYSLWLIKHLCAITADFKSKSIWQRLTKLGVPCDVSRCTHFLNSQHMMKCNYIPQIQNPVDSRKTRQF